MRHSSKSQFYAKSSEKIRYNKLRKCKKSHFFYSPKMNLPNLFLLKISMISMEPPSVKTILAPTIIQGFVIFRTLMINDLEITSKKPFVGMIENFGRLLMQQPVPVFVLLGFHFLI